jgi:muconolactone delta-isomerase
MNEYMVTIQLPEQPNAEFISLIPTQREHVNELIQRGLLLSYSLSQNREILWVVIVASSPESALRILKTMPLFPHMQYAITELMFHTTPALAAPQYSLN